MRVKHRPGDRAMMPLTLFGSRPFVGPTLMTFLLYGALGGLLVLLPFLLIVGGGYSPTQAGLALLPFSIVIGLGSRLTGRLTARVGPRWPLSIGLVVTALGFALMVRADPQASYWTSIPPAITVIAIGMAFAVAPVTTAVLSSVDGGHTGIACGFKSAVACTGGLVATALTRGVMTASATHLSSTFHVAAVVAARSALGYVTLR